MTVSLTWSGPGWFVRIPEKRVVPRDGIDVVRLESGHVGLPELLGVSLVHKTRKNGQNLVQFEFIFFGVLRGSKLKTLKG